jgi:hypothetical protein
MDRKFLLSFKLSATKGFSSAYKTKLFSFISGHASDIVSMSLPEKGSIRM